MPRPKGHGFENSTEKIFTLPNRRGARNRGVRCIPMFVVKIQLSEKNLLTDYEQAEKLT